MWLSYLPDVEWRAPSQMRNEELPLSAAGHRGKRPCLRCFGVLGSRRSEAWCWTWLFTALLCGAEGRVLGLQQMPVQQQFCWPRGLLALQCPAEQQPRGGGARTTPGQCVATAQSAAGCWAVNGSAYFCRCHQAGVGQAAIGQRCFAVGGQCCSERCDAAGSRDTECCGDEQCRYGRRPGSPRRSTTR